jgi:hypothetical protein
MKTINSGVFLMGGFLEVTIFKGRLYARRDQFYENLDHHSVTIVYGGRKYVTEIESNFERIGRGNTI